jgi:membrane protein required for colicin V production
MFWIDLVLGLSLLGYIWGGFTAGLIQSVGGLVGLVIGSMVASSKYEAFAPGFTSFAGNNELLGKVLAFAAIVFVVSRIVAVLFILLDRIFHIVAIIPGLKFFNRILGAVFGFLEGALFLGLTLQVANHLPITQYWAQQLHDSRLAPFLLNVTAWLIPLLPGALKSSQSALDKLIPSTLNVNVPLQIPLK